MTTLTPREHESLRETKARLKDILLGCAAVRDQRDEFTADGKELGWQRFELDMMHCAVNNERERLGRPPVGLAVIEMAERQARGHCDYADQWPWHCAEIVFGRFALAPEATAP